MPGRKEISIHSFEELAALHAIARILAQPGELRDQIQQALQEMSNRLGMQRGMISLIDRETGTAWLDVAHGVDIQGLDITYRPGEGITGKVAQTGRPMACANLGKAAQFLDRTGARRNLNRSELAFLCVPIIYDGRVVGVLSADKVALQVENLDRELAMLSSIAELLAKEVHNRGIEEENRRLRRMLAEARRPITNIIGRSKVVQEVLRLIDQVADTNTTVLIRGETGTGKELVAKALHENSRRRKFALVQVNCAAMPDTLLESELFGHEKGAFTGAVTRRRGRFEEAQGGTIFLDEVGELSPIAQAKLLRVLQEREFQPLGSSRTVKVDVRVITATNKDLEKEVAMGTVRSDLYYRLNVFPIFLPPLRERGPDILLLADHFVLKYAREFSKEVTRISTSAIDMLMSYHWPGNVRELENCIERAIILCTDGVIHSYHLPPNLKGGGPDGRDTTASGFRGIMASMEREIIMEELKRTGGNMAKAARALGITERMMGLRVARYGIDTGRFKGKGGK